MSPEQSESTQAILENLAFASLREQRRTRRWGIFFKFCFLLYFIALLWMLLPNDPLTIKKSKPHTALIDIRGPIFDAEPASADNVAASLHMAFKDPNTQGIILRINSPGGSPVQAAYVYDEVQRLSKKYPAVKVYAVCTDICTSAAYYIAASAAQIYANPASLVGSIGVLMDSFGFVDAMQKVGIQRRLFTSGSHKGFLDPFSPLKADDEKYVQSMLDTVHQQFINSVRTARGNKLKETPELYSGLAWTGQQALGLGLVDGFGSPGYVAREIIKNSNIVDYTIKPNYIDLIATRLGAAFAGELTTQLGLHQTRLR